VTVLTCHALAMRLVGASFSERLHKREQVDGDVFREILQQAIALLNGTDLPPEEAVDFLPSLKEEDS
jgi:ATP-dependent DNA helicase RecQ